MKTNFYILIIFLLTVSFAGAQNKVEVVNNENVKAVSVSNNNENTEINEAVLIDAKELKESIAKSASDIRIYLNRVRKVDNLNLLFPKIHKAAKA
ncbi:hypothetical protein [Gaetbulibacter saemankumensis]|uniref:hypothetical protein n=1 Tax=Gaetbulibacter saemankumensis TaxID=311208 RepID=UPI0003FDC28E|nr:hypothetical protein [Gaetbulibacter saemankumensis]